MDEKNVAELEIRASQPEEPQRVMGFGAALIACFWWSIPTFALSFVSLVWRRRAAFAGTFEWALAARALLPVSFVAAWVAAPVCAVLVWARRRSATRRVVVAAVLSSLTFAVAWQSSTGRLLAGWKRPAFVILAVVVSFAATVLLWPRVCSGLRRLTSRPAAIALAAIAWLGLHGANLWLLPRLYPAFHDGLSALAVMAWLVLAVPHQTTRHWRRWALVAGAVGASAALISVWQAPELRSYNNIRAIALESGPLMGRLVQVAAAGGQPAAVPGAGPERPMEGSGAPGSLTGHDVFLISVDALRPDHLGVYGGKRPTPAIDGLARRGVAFSAAYTPTPHTSYALTSLMTGKYMRPLLLQGAGQDSQTFAGTLQRYGFRTAAFYPPAAFFVDRSRFQSFEERGFDFEYKKVEFLDAEARVDQVLTYLDDTGSSGGIFVWVHFFEPHEPYLAHADFDYGTRDIERYDAEIAAVDRAIGRLVREVDKRRRRPIFVLTADHGEEFGEHGGRYHGTSVYEEQVRVPLIVATASAPVVRASAPPPPTQKVQQVVSLVDVMPSVLSALGIPSSPRMAGRDVSALFDPARVERDDALRTEPGLAMVEIDAYSMLASGAHRLVCDRRVDACRLFDLSTDPKQHHDVSNDQSDAFERLRARSNSLLDAIGEFEFDRDDRWPPALRRGLNGDVGAMVHVAGLMEDTSVVIRRKAAEVLFELMAVRLASARSEGEPGGVTPTTTIDVGPQLRRALREDDDRVVRYYSALALTRLGQGAPVVFDMLESNEKVEWQRLAALVLAEQGDSRGERILIVWWDAAFPRRAEKKGEPLAHDRAKQLMAAFAAIKSEHAAYLVPRALRDVRLRVAVAEALAGIGENAGRPPLAKALKVEPYHHARVAMAKALVSLGAEGELRDPLVRFLGVPDPIEGGVGMAEAVGILNLIGGPRKRELRRLRQYGSAGVSIGVTIPSGGNGKGLRVLLRGRSRDHRVAEVRFGASRRVMVDGSRANRVPKFSPRLEPELTVTLSLKPGTDQEVYVTLPPATHEWAEPGKHSDFVVISTQNAHITAFAVVPLADEL